MSHIEGLIVVFKAVREDLQLMEQLKAGDFRTVGNSILSKKGGTEARLNPMVRDRGASRRCLQ